MNVQDRRIKESPLYQGEDEQVAYSLTTTPWGSSPTNVSVVVKDEDGNNVTSSVTSGNASVVGDVITLPMIQGLTAGEDYRVEIKFTIGGNVMETWVVIKAQK